MNDKASDRVLGTGASVLAMPQVSQVIFHFISQCFIVLIYKRQITVLSSPVNYSKIAEENCYRGILLG